ncbi:TetR/AcrR family transcriptional regulator [Fructilactobacillus frigidiflavus]|uniref:TetR/AcrR family transcriptional regulator n=1 Tax=Fructilactobacillus frigidiflavus TaxID=3242688 RepID=UPI003757293F
MNKKMNKSTIRSKKWLVNAFFELLGEKEYSDITIKDIADKAQLARRTFYRLFDNKQDLLNTYCDKLFDEYFEIIQKKSNEITTFEDILDIVFDFWWSKRNEISILIKRDIFLPFMLQRLDKFKNIYLAFDFPWHLNASENATNYIVDYFVGGQFNIIDNWLSKDNPETPEYIAKLLMKSISKIN